MVFSFKGHEIWTLEWDLYVLKAQLDFVKEQIPLQTQKQKHELDKKLADYDQSDEVEAAIAWNEIRDYRLWVDEELPRLVINPFIVSVWALYESVLSDLAAILQEKRGKSLGLSDIKGKHMVQRADKYFTHVLQFPIDYSEDRKAKLNFLGAFRNAIAHSNGKMSGLKQGLRTRIENGEFNGVSASGDRTRVVLEVEYAQSAFDTVSEHLKLLFERFEPL